MLDGRNQYSWLLFTSEDCLCANLRMQDQSTNMMSQCQYPQIHVCYDSLPLMIDYINCLSTMLPHWIYHSLALNHQFDFTSSLYSYMIQEYRIWSMEIAISISYLCQGCLHQYKGRLCCHCTVWKINTCQHGKPEAVIGVRKMKRHCLVSVYCHGNETDLIKNKDSWGLVPVYHFPGWCMDS